MLRTALRPNCQTRVTSKSAGEFEWDSKGEYGPFDSFYAVFDADGNMCYHLDARDLTKNVHGEKVFNPVKSLILPDRRFSKYYTVMWVLPKIYISSTPDTLSISNRAEFGGKPLAHSLDLDGDGIAEKEFEYLGFGVYPSYVKDDVAYSMQGVTPARSMNVIQFSKCIESYKLSSLNQGYSMQWNWYQWSLLKFCTYIALGTLDSQSFAKGCVGKKSNEGPNTNGVTDVAKNGYYSGSDDKSSVRLFVENPWGNVNTWLSNTFFMSDGLYVSQSPVAQNDSKAKGMKKIQSYDYGGINTNNPGMMYTDSLESWGLPFFESKATANGMKDYAYVSGSVLPVAIVGGIWLSGSRAGVSSLYARYTTSGASVYVGSRPVLLFDADAASKVTLSPKNDPDKDMLTILNSLKMGQSLTGVTNSAKDNGAKNQKSGVVTYEAEFREIFSQIDVSCIISDPDSLVGAMADKKFSKSNVNVMRSIISGSQELLIKILKEDNCDIHAISKQISDDTSLDVNKIEPLLFGLYKAL